MKHLIKIETTEHGALSVRHMGKDQQWCEAGLSVKVNNQPDAGWGLQKLYYVVAGSSEKHPIDIMTRTFIMPNGNVTIGGVFKRFVIGDWTEGKQPNVGMPFIVGPNGEPTPGSWPADSGGMVEVTHDELETMANEGGLTPGSWYRITDYVATTKKAGTQSANHPFDIIVRADSEDTLNENAYAARNANDTHFAQCHMQSWRLKYDVYNNATRFAWADEDNGKGVVYWMRDERGNEAPFDFKGIVFERSTEWFGDHAAWCESVLGEVPQESLWLYFLSFVDENGDVQDASVMVFKDGGCYGNVEGMFNNNQILSLPDNVIVESYYYEEGLVYYSNSNTFGNNCNGNTFGNNCYNNTFGNGCYSNTFVNDCTSNTFGNGCYSNTFGNNCTSNTFGNDCTSNTFGNDCTNNTFGNNCYNNTFGNYCTSNTFGNGCYNNTFGNGCTNNTFGNNCYNNTFGNDCTNNTFGNNCYNNTFGNGCTSNTFGNGCYNITLVGGCTSNTFGNMCRHITSGTNTVVYVHVLDLVHGTQQHPVNLNSIGVQPFVLYNQYVAGTSGNPDNYVVWNPADITQ